MGQGEITASALSLRFGNHSQQHRNGYQGGYPKSAPVPLGPRPTVEASPDLIATELNMPRIDGSGLTEAVRTGDAAARVPVLIPANGAGAKLKHRLRRPAR